ncbi:MAG: hypothetical protein CMJ64_04625 [Planctomycetaceae bacterium]|nr:hypothetical protein [Planctomycetaceae bacterium]
MFVELVRTKTSDGLRLDGSLALPTSDAVPLPVDAVILLHGVGGSFFGGSMFDALSIPFLERGAAVLRVNTRGYGSINMIATDGGPTRGGAAFETVDHCRHDINAWLQFLVAHGFRRIGLLGHSLGAIKAVYAAAHETLEEVVCIIAASPPRLSCSAFQNGPRSADYFKSMSAAKQLMKEGRPEALITAKFPFPLMISAAGYIDKYGDERYNILKFVDQICLPTLFTYGSIELEQGGIAFAGLPDAIRGALADHAPVDCRTIPDADHFYSGKYDELGRAILDWLPVIEA